MSRGASILDQLRDIPPLRTMQHTIDAECFNSARVALHRFGAPLTVELQRPTLVLLLDEHDWVAVPPWDLALPLLHWSGFHREHPDHLHENVLSELRLFDIRSGLVMRTALDALQHALRDMLAPDHL